MKDIIKICVLAVGIIIAGYIACRTVCPSEWYPVRLQGVDCTMRIIKNPILMPKLREQEAAVRAEERRQRWSLK